MFTTSPNLDEIDNKLFNKVRKSFPSLVNSFEIGYRDLEQLTKKSFVKNLTNTHIFSVTKCFKNVKQRFVDIVHLSPEGNSYVSKCIYKLLKNDLN